MSTVELLQLLRARDIKIWLEGDSLRLSAPRGVMTPDLRARLAAAKPELLALLHQTASSDEHSLPLSRPAYRDGPVPQSSAQERLWILAQMEPDSASYNISGAVRLEGELDRAALAKAVTAMVERHEILRTTLALQDGEPVQVVMPAAAVSLDYRDLTYLPLAVRPAEAKRLAVAGAKEPFDLARGPLLRLQLLQLGDSDHVLAYTMHHIISDGWSMGIFVRELVALYQAIAAGAEPELPPLPLQYGDYAQWQRQWLQGEIVAKQLLYWQQQLDKAPVLSLPTDFPRPPQQTFNGSQFVTVLPASLTAALEAESRATEVTLFMLLLAAFQVLLYRYSGDDDICVGTPVANRVHPDLEKLIGFFVNTLVLRTDLRGEPTFRELLARVRETALAAYANQDVPFSRVVAELQPRRDLSRSPLFQVMFVLQNAPAAAASLPGLKVTPWTLDNETAKFDLLLSAAVRGSGELALTWEYNTDLFAQATVQQMAAHFHMLLEKIATDPDRSIARLPLLSPAERRKILLEWNDTAVPQAPFQPVHQMVSAQAVRQPEAVAVAAPLAEAGPFPARLTYAELDARANQVARFLQNTGVGTNDLVAVAMDRSVEMAVAVLGVLKAGAAYVPLDPAYPQERLSFMLRDTAVSVILTQSHLRTRLNVTGLPAAPLVVDVDTWEQMATFATSAPSVQTGPDDLIYVIYTSGSTGRPKGVMLPHRALSNLILWQQQTKPGAGARTLQFAPLSFDVSCQEMFTTWASGGTLILVDEPVRQDPAILLRFVIAQQVTRLFLPYVALRQLAEVAAAQTLYPATLQEVITAGEPLQVTPALVAMFTAVAPCRLINQYGPSETHVVTAHTLPPDPADWPQHPPIGTPIANTQIYLLDGNDEPVPIGVAGELVIGGSGVAHGYLNRPRLTAARFTHRPNSLTIPTDRGSRISDHGLLYRTGDLARYLPDGSTVFLGRLDDQVKVRGYRVEPGEVEAVLAQHTAVQQVVVLADDAREGGKQMVAYVVAAATTPPTVAALRYYLAQRLPDYMIPARFVFLSSLPLTNSGKIDRRALPAMQPLHAQAKPGQSGPQTATEAALVPIWQRLLESAYVGIDDDFFELGGHSLLAVRLFLDVAEAFDVNLPITTLFRGSTIRELAQIIDEQPAAGTWSSLVPIQIEGENPPFFCVHGGTGDVLWFGPLARHLRPGQPFYGLQSRGLDGIQAPLTTVEEMAAHYLAELRSKQAYGPYYLGGYCFGGVIAYEMAQQLILAGEEVALLVNVSSTSPRLSTTRADGRAIRALSFFGAVPRWLAHLQDLGPQVVRARLRRKLRVLRNVLAGHDYPQATAADIVDEAHLLPRHRQQIIELNQQALREYRPRPYPGRIVVLQPRTPSLFRLPRRGLGWDRVAQAGITVRMVPGSHQSMFKEPRVRLLARRLQGALDRAQMEAGVND